MWILKILTEKKTAMAGMGAAATAEAKAAGISSYYEDPSAGDGIVEERPDGTKRLISGGSTRAA